jgi:hypothetical protein
MNPRELVDHIRSGPAKLMLNDPLRFRRRIENEMLNGEVIRLDGAIRMAPR